jgi:hypothetical protein
MLGMAVWTVHLWLIVLYLMATTMWHQSLPWLPLIITKKEKTSPYNQPQPQESS